MSDDVRAWAIEAGARALHKHDRDAIGATLRCGGLATCSRCQQWASYATAVVDVAVPIIWAAREAEVRERIAAEIRSACDREHSALIYCSCYEAAERAAG